MTSTDILCICLNEQPRQGDYNFLRMPNSNLFIDFLHASSSFTYDGVAFPFFVQYVAEKTSEVD